MTKSELVGKIAAKLPNLTLRDIERIVNVVFERMAKALTEGNRIEIRGFGAFSVRQRKPRVAINPKNKTKTSLVLTQFCGLHAKLMPSSADSAP